MIPLTSSLYVPGQIDDIEHIIVELGAGYFAEHTIDGASKYCDRKIGFLNDSIKKVGEIIDVKAR